MATAIEILATRLGSIDINKNLDALFSTAKYDKFIPDMIRERLWEQGIYSTGQPIKTYSATAGNVYSAYTIEGTESYEGKKAKNQPYDRVTLRDTGDFYRSFTLQPKSTYAVVAYDENKPDGKVSDNVDLDNVFNLSPGEMTALREEVIPDMITMIKQQLLA